MRTVLVFDADEREDAILAQQARGLVADLDAFDRSLHWSWDEGGHTGAARAAVDTIWDQWMEVRWRLRGEDSPIPSAVTAREFSPDQTKDGRSLAERITALQGDERGIVELIMGRLEQGRRDYGPWHVGDGRDYHREALEEYVDGALYIAAEMLRRMRHPR